MPELPEVEVVCQGLQARLLNAKITSVEIYTPPIALPDPGKWPSDLVGQSVSALERRAKYLILRLSQDCLLIHLRMTGQILLQEAQTKMLPLPFTFYQRPVIQLPDKHTHLSIGFSNGIRCFFRDIRKFGRIEKLTPAALTHHPSLCKLGIEPLGSEYTWSRFKHLLQGQRTIKAFLLDQSRIAGIGNIYADEALFLARIHPQRVVSSLSTKEAQRLYAAIPKILKKAIASGGTTLKDYLHPDGQGGHHQEELQVYGRAKAPCLRCGNPVKKIVVAQRGTHFCPHCQT